MQDTQFPDKKAYELHTAGVRTATADRRRGMTLEQMEHVPQLTDNVWWAQGYRDKIEDLRSDLN